MSDEISTELPEAIHSYIEVETIDGTVTQVEDSSATLTGSLRCPIWQISLAAVPQVEL